MIKHKSSWTLDIQICSNFSALAAWWGVKEKCWQKVEQSNCLTIDANILPTKKNTRAHTLLTVIQHHCTYFPIYCTASKTNIQLITRRESIFTFTWSFWMLTLNVSTAEIKRILTILGLPLWSHAFPGGNLRKVYLWIYAWGSCCGNLQDPYLKSSRILLNLNPWGNGS